jgi:hypothetical protein
MKYCVHFPMFQSAKRIGLDSIISAISASGLDWQLLEFNGVGSAPNGMAMPDFEAKVRSSGHRMSETEFAQFVAGNEQIWDCLIVAVDSSDSRTAAEIEEQKFSGVKAVVEGIDSTSWEIRTEDIQLVQKLSLAFGADIKSGL